MLTLNALLRECRPPAEVLKAVTAEMARLRDEEDDQLPLHAALEATYPSEVLKAILEAYPNAAREKNDDNELPLHTALHLHHTVERRGEASVCWRSIL